MNQQRAILAGGCFWGMEDLFRKYKGVLKTTVGYAGGSLVNPTYKDMKSSANRHAEAIEIFFDADVLLYEDLLKFFFQLHDPTTIDRQGNDRGASYRSAIFYLDDSQKTVAESLIAKLDTARIFPGKIVTEISPATPFYKAESEHQDYLEHYPNGYTCHFVRPNWRL